MHKRPGIPIWIFKQFQEIFARSNYVNGPKRTGSERSTTEWLLPEAKRYSVSSLLTTVNQLN